MSKGPGLFSDIGKKAKDLLTRDYTQDQKITVSSFTDVGVDLTSTVAKKGDLSIGDFGAVYKYNDTVIEAKVDAKSNISTTFTFLEVFPSTKCITTLKFPDYKSGKVEFQHLHHHGAFTAAVGLSQSPVLDLSLTLGSPGVAVGVEAGYDSLSNTLTKYTAGIGVTRPEASFAIFLVDKGDLLKASYHHLVQAEKNTIAVAEASRKISTSENAFSIGAAHNIDPLTIVKAKVDNFGKVSALLQHELKPKSVFTISGEFDTKALEKSPKFGLALALKP